MQDLPTRCWRTQLHHPALRRLVIRSTSLVGKARQRFESAMLPLGLAYRSSAVYCRKQPIRSLDVLTGWSEDRSDEIASTRFGK